MSVFHGHLCNKYRITAALKAETDIITTKAVSLIGQAEILVDRVISLLIFGIPNEINFSRSFCVHLIWDSEYQKINQLYLNNDAIIH
jgi:hypothetical protein